MPLSSPAPVGDAVEPTIDQDAAVALKRVLYQLKRERGQAVHDCASYAIAALGQNDGLTSKDLGDAIAFELDLEESDGPILVGAILELERRDVISYRGDRLYLNPAISDLVLREVSR